MRSQACREIATNLAETRAQIAETRRAVDCLVAEINRIAAVRTLAEEMLPRAIVHRLPAARTRPQRWWRRIW